MTHSEFDPQLLLTLSQRLLMTHAPGGFAENLQIFVGQLPPQLAVDLPLPEATTIIGSLVWEGESVQIVLDVAQPTAAILAFYEAHLIAMGWRRLDDLIEPKQSSQPVRDWRRVRAKPPCGADHAASNFRNYFQ